MGPHCLPGLRIRIISLGGLCLLFLSLLVLFGTTPSAQASSNISVSTTADETNPADGACSLREAIAAIDTGAASGGTAGECPASSPGDAILVPTGTYTLTQGELVITASLTISGSGQIATILDGNNQDRVIEIANPAAAVTLDSLTFSDGKGYYTAAVAFVGGILNSGVLSLTNSSVVSNTGEGVHSLGKLLVLSSVVSGNAGSGVNNAGGVALITGTTASHNLDGAIYSSGRLTVTNSTLFSNTAGFGGGLYVYTGTQALVQDSSLSGNQSAMGAAVYNLGGLVLSNTNVLSNTASDSGIIQNGWNGAPATTTVQSSTFTGNVAKYGGSGIQNWLTSTLTVTQTSFQDNLTTYGLSGPGVLLNEGYAWVSSSSFNYNHAESGAAIYNDGRLNLIGSTLSHNAATGSGGAVVSLNGSADISGTLFDSNSAGNEGGAVYGGALTLTNSSLMNNLAVQHGGAIASVTGESVSATGITVTNNTAQIGGGIFARGALHLSGSQVISNSATGYAAGGGLYAFGTSAISILNSTFADNSGGAIYNSGGGSPSITLVISDSLFSNNQSAFDGAAINNQASHLTIISTTFASNATTSSIFGGGAIYDFSPSLTIVGSSFYSNTSARNAGALLHNVGPLSITNSTFSGNEAAWSAGGILLGIGAATLNNVTIFGNKADHTSSGPGGGGLVVESGAGMTVANTIIAGNIDLSGQAPDCAGTLTTSGHNLIQSTLGCTLSGTATGDITGSAALLGPLQDNGGSTWTQALLPGSPAIDAGSPAPPGSGGDACEATDQRGVTRPQGFACDIGAYEAIGLSVTPTVQLANNAFTVTQTSGSVPITATLSRVMPVTVTVQFSTMDGTALAGSDYTAASGTLTFTPGVTQTTFTIPITPDPLHDADETLSVALSSPVSATLGTPYTATVTILNDHPAPGVSFSSQVYTVTESGGMAVITATLSAASGLTATVQFAASNGTATAGSDYAPISGTLTFAPGQVQQVITVPISDDMQLDGPETVLLTLSGPVEAALIGPSSATLTILENDADFKMYLPIVKRP